jgi:hypothetical protein
MTRTLSPYKTNISFQSFWISNNREDGVEQREHPLMRTFLGDVFPKAGAEHA